MSKTSTTAATMEVEIERKTYWCHDCDMSVSLCFSSSSSSSSPLQCPHCATDFLELMDSPLSPRSSPLLDHSFLRRLIHRLSTSSSDDDDEDHFSADDSGPLPASKSSIAAIPTIEISDDVDLDLCAVCNDRFVAGAVVKRLPCGHLYHPECILPWLELHNSCPLCRFRLPAEEKKSTDCCDLGGVFESSEDMVLMAEDWFDYACTLRYIARRHNLLLSEEEVEEAGRGAGDAVTVPLSSVSENSR